MKSTNMHEEDANLVQPAQQELHKRWDGTASMSVLVVDEGNGVVFRTTASDILSLADSPHLTFHIVKPEMKWCSCGVWQDTLFPCHHACAVYRHKFGRDMNYVSFAIVHDYYKHGF